MASSQTSPTKRLIMNLFPFLFRICPDGNKHWFHDDFCQCKHGENANDFFIYRHGKWRAIKENKDCW